MCGFACESLFVCGCSHWPLEYSICWPSVLFLVFLQESWRCAASCFQSLIGYLSQSTVDVLLRFGLPILVIVLPNLGGMLFVRAAISWVLHITNEQKSTAASIPEFNRTSDSVSGLSVLLFFTSWVVFLSVPCV